MNDNPPIERDRLKDHCTRDSSGASVPRIVEEGMKKDGFDVTTYVPQLLLPKDLSETSIVVSFEDIAVMIDGPSTPLKSDDLPSVLADYPRGRAAIVLRVQSLIDQLERGGAR